MSLRSVCFIVCFFKINANFSKSVFFLNQAVSQVLLHPATLQIFLENVLRVKECKITYPVVLNEGILWLINDPKWLDWADLS